MANDVVDIVIGEKAYQQVGRLLNDLDDLNVKMIELIGTSQKLSKNPLGVGSTGEAKSRVKELSTNSEQLNATLKKQDSTMSKLAVKYEEINRKAQAETKATDMLKKSKERLNLTRSKEYVEIVRNRNESNNNTRVLKRLETFYGIVSQKLIKTTAEYKNLSVRQEIKNNLTDKEVQKMALLEKRIDKYRGALTKADERSGQFGRNVGNYKSGFNGMSNSINQITREMPAFSNSMQTGFLAISNNIPQVFDEITRLKKANVELMSQGQPTKSVLMQITKSLFSWQTALSLGVTLLTVYGKELVEYIINLSKTTSQLEISKKATKEYNKAVAESSASVKKEVVELKALLSIAKDETVSREKRNDAVEILQKKYPKYLKNLSIENASTREIATAINQVTKSLMQKAKLQAAEQIITTKFKETLEKEVEVRERITRAEKARAKAEQLRQAVSSGSQEKMLELSRQEFENSEKTTKNNDVEVKQKAQLFDLEKENKKTLKERLELQKKFSEVQVNNRIESSIKTELEDEVLEIEEYINILESILRDAPDLMDLFGSEDTSSLDAAENQIDHLFQLKKYMLEREISLSNDVIANEENNDSKRLASLENSYNRQLQLSDLVHQKEIDTATGNADERLLIDKKHADERLDIERDYINKKIEISALEDIDFAQRLKDRVNEVGTFEYQELKQLNDLLKDKEITIEEHEKKVAEIKKRYAIESLETQLQVLKAQINADDLTASQRIELLNKIAKIELALSNLKIEKAEETNKVLDFFNSEEFKRAIEIRDGIAEVTNALFDNRAQRYEDDIQKNNDYYAKILDNERLTEEQRSQLEAERDAKNAVLEKKAREEKRKQAIFNKLLALTDIAINTAKAISLAAASAPPPANIPLIAFAAAIGVAQAATVIATPIPQYKKGKKKSDNYEGIALLNDGGRNEVRVDKYGNASIIEGRNVLGHVSKDDVIYPSVDAFNSDMSKSLMATNVLASQGSKENELKAMLSGVRGEIKEGFKNVKVVNRNHVHVNSFDRNAYIKSKMQ